MTPKTQRSLIIGIRRLVNVDDGWNEQMSHLPVIEGAALLIEAGKIARYGKEETLKKELAAEGILQSITEIIDIGGGDILPSYCDSHTHLLFPTSRETELFDRLRGLSYEEISKRGGGILNSARKMESTSDEELLENALMRLDQLVRNGTGTVEIKSGYGLTPVQEIRMLRLIKELKKHTPLTICATFLGAHAFPEPFREKRDAYVEQIISEMLPVVAKENLAEFVDVFCEKGFFSVEQTERILMASKSLGLIPRLHANQFTHSGAIGCAVRQGAITVDHLEVMNDEEIELLKHSRTMPTLLPGCAFFMSSPYPPARKMIDAGLQVVLASDFNPGTNPSGDMKFMISLACLKMGMCVSEAIQASTRNGAKALLLGDSHGSIGIGKRADLQILKPLPSLEYIPYAYTEPLVKGVILGGNLLNINS